jgi:ubiquitin carboxyl-terminal hydrolase 34
VFDLICTVANIASVPLGAHYKDQDVAQLLALFFKGYTNLTIRLLQASADMASKASPDSFIESSPLGLAAPHLHQMRILLWTENPFIKICSLEGIDISHQMLRNIVVGQFLKDEDLPMKFLRQYFDLCLELLKAAPDAPDGLVQSLSVAVQSISFIFSDPTLAANVHNSRSTYAQMMMQMFFSLNERLRDAVDKQNDPLSLDNRREIYTNAIILLEKIIQYDKKCEQTLFDEFVGSNGEVDDAYERSNVIVPTWRILLMKHYLCNGRMELRIAAVDGMGQELVEFFNSNRPHGHMVRSDSILPAFQVVANVLVNEKIVEHLMGVSSHPKIVARCGNIIGFLVVTNKFRQDEIELVWQTMQSTEDPRMTAAIFNTLAFIAKTLTDPLEHYIMCQKMVEQPLPLSSMEAAEYVRTLLCRQRDALRGLDNDSDYLRAFLKMCISIFCRWRQTTISNVAMKQIYNDTVESLAVVAKAMAYPDRVAFYPECIVRIRERDVNGSVYMTALNGVIQPHPQDVDEIASELIPLCMESFCEFSRTRKSGEPNSFFQERVRVFEEYEYRLSLLFYLLAVTSVKIPGEVTSGFWQSAFGNDAVDTESRDIAWKFLLTASFDKRGNERKQSIGSFYEPYLHTIQPDHYVPSFVNFVVQMGRSRLRDLSARDQGADNVLSLPGLDLIWKVMLTAPSKPAEDPTAKFLIALYLNRIEIERISGTSLEANHAALVKRCIKRMDEAYEYLKSNPKSSTNESLDSMEIDTESIGQERREFEKRAFQRIVQFMIQMLMAVRRRADLVVTEPVEFEEEEEEHSESPIIAGDRITIKYQVHTGKEQHPQRELVVGDLDTRKELHQKLAKLVGLAKFKVIWGGQYFALLDNPSQSLRDCGAAGKTQMLIREDPTDPMGNHASASTHARTLFEKEVLKEFDVLYKFMDDLEMTNERTYELLKHFEPHESICLLVADESQDAEDVFPAADLFKMHYALRALESLLKDQTRAKAQKKDQPSDKEFSVHAVRLLESLFVERPLPEEEKARSNYLHLFNTAVPIWNGFLAELGCRDESPFKDGTKTVERILEVLGFFLKSPTSAGVAGQTYELMLSTCFVCSNAWSVFSNSDKVQSLHRDVFLTNPNSRIRSNIVNTIKTRIARTPKDWHMNSWDLIKYYWDAVASLVPECSNHAENSKELFMLSAYIFLRRFTDKKAELDDAEFEQLGRYQVEWADYLLGHERHEFVGREVTDNIIVGLCSLIQACFQVLSDVKDARPLETLAERLWSSMLFPPKVNYGGVIEIPLLDSTTRTAVYNLLRAITVESDPASGQKVAEWAEEIAAETDDLSSRWSVERTRLIRSESGYLGLRNLSNTCYMNSLMTQLYMNPAFREFMLAQPIKDYRKQRLLRQTQILFSSMQQSYGPYGDGLDFTKELRVYEEELNIHEQMDVEEFFNILFDQWESNLLDADTKEALRSFYTGKLVYQVMSKECQHVSQREESFFNIQCDVQGKATLADSLASFCEGDAMQGDNKWKCEECNKFVNAVRRSSIKEAPDHLILHLKRFEFDIASQRRNKINDHFEFPMALDITPYSFAHVSQPQEEHQQDIFELTGVLVHKGAAEHGHYVSYIRARPGEEGKDPLWLLFDDSEVSVFDPRDLGDACFGGLNENKDQYSTVSPKVYNAYMLFYQRRSSIKNVPRSMSTHIFPKDLGNVPIPRELENNINLENADILRAYCIFGEPHQQFVRSFTQYLVRCSHDDDHETHKAMIYAAFQTLWRVIARVKDNSEFVELMKQLRLLVETCPRCTYLMFNWIGVHVLEFRDLLARCTFQKVRLQVQNLVLVGLISLRDVPELYGISSDDDAPNFNGVGVIYNMIEVFMTIVRDQLHFTSRGFEEFFSLLQSLVERKQDAWAFINGGFVEVCLQIMLITEYEVFTKSFPRTSNMFDKKDVPFNTIADFFCTLIKHLDFTREAEKAERIAGFDLTEQTLPITSYERTLFTLKTKFGVVWLKQVFERWSNDRPIEQFVPASMLKVFMLGNKDDPEVLLNVARTVARGIEEDKEMYLRSAIAYLQHCPSRHFVHLVMNAMDNTVQDLAESELKMDVRNGHYFMEYYSSLRVLRNKHLEEEEERDEEVERLDFAEELLNRCVYFGPSLLTYDHDEEVRNSAKELLIDVLLSRPPMADPDAEKPTVEEEQRVKIVRDLAEECWKKITVYLEIEASKSAMQPIIVVQEYCARFLNTVMALGENGDVLKDERDVLIIENFQGKQEQISCLLRNDEEFETDYLTVGQSAYEAASEWSDDDLGDYNGLKKVDLSDDELSGLG